MPRASKSMPPPCVAVRHTGRKALMKQRGAGGLRRAGLSEAQHGRGLQRQPVVHGHGSGANAVLITTRTWHLDKGIQ